MARQSIAPTGRERTFGRDEIIVSKTDPKGRLLYVNDVFLTVSGFTEEQLLGQPHCIIRHPDMPRSIFKLLWDTILGGKEIFAYVNNMAENGDNYWVFAHVTPNIEPEGQIVGFHSNRRVPEPHALGIIRPLYARLVELERAEDRKAGVETSYAALMQAVADAGFDSYDRFIFAITNASAAGEMAA